MTSRSRRRCRAILLLIAALACAEWPLADISGQERSGEPSARLIPAPSTVLPGQADSNSPVLWELVSGRSQMFLLTSVNGRATRHTGPLLSRLTSTGDVAFVEHPGHGVWFEAIVRDEDGTWYGFYHNEWPDVVCDNDTRVIPKIGAARSRDFGTTWENLGIILEAPPNSHDCASTNKYFVGGVGDFSVALDATRQYLYLFFSQYGRREMSQGVSVARMAWADRDAPAGKLAVWWRKQVWLPTRVVASDEVSASSTLPARRSTRSPTGGTTTPASTRSGDRPFTGTRTCSSTSCCSIAQSIPPGGRRACTCRSCGRSTTRPPGRRRSA